MQCLIDQVDFNYDFSDTTSLPCKSIKHNEMMEIEESDFDSNCQRYIDFHQSLCCCCCSSDIFTSSPFLPSSNTFRSIPPHDTL